MKRVAGLMLGAAMAGLAAEKLPSWGEVDVNSLVEAGWEAGGELLAEGAPGLAWVTKLEPPVAEQTPEKLRDPVPEEFLGAYFAEAPARYLTDPQELLGPTDGDEQESFLAYHAGDSKIDLRVFLFDGGQGIPAEVRQDELVERFFAEGKPTLLVMYFLGAPERAAMFPSPHLAGSLGEAEKRRMLQAAVQAAEKEADAVAQMKAFFVQTTIRIYWLERAAGLLGGDEVTVAPVVPAAAGLIGKADRFAELKAGFGKLGGEWGVLALLVAGMVATAGCGLWFLRRREVLRFPEFEVEPRLGGAHAAGIGPVIAFGSTTQSPTTQKRGVGDSLGGI